MNKALNELSGSVFRFAEAFEIAEIWCLGHPNPCNFVCGFPLSRPDHILWCIGGHDADRRA